MRRHLPDAVAKAALKELDERLDRAALRRQVERDRAAFGAAAAVERVSKGETHRLWSNGSTSGAFQNNHECWKYFEPVS